jgi:hypothetical protein
MYLSWAENHSLIHKASYPLYQHLRDTTDFCSFRGFVFVSFVERKKKNMNAIENETWQLEDR